MTKKVFISRCYDLLHSNHIEFFREAASFGDLYVALGSDKPLLISKAAYGSTMKVNAFRPNRII